ncbi:IS3 family transposase [Hymenobacter sp. BT186]|uniref:IS3 family transposase n=1 Tax=Hymenobacter telluris TaxID=2816474 RepID=A0A939F0R4_9BACT|nr:IS3 family transposase [Hymenobacter telluris]MBO0360724.1 IS3 family transposase [Hymenobacter telluris]MBW3376751.1 IS3 family transposase [Hymenobacter norwichensis]
MSRYRFVRAQTRHYSVRQLCQVLGVGVASYYRWRQKVAVRFSVPAWEKELCHVFFQHKRRYGTRRLQAELRAQGYRVGRHRIRHALRRRELVAVQPRAFVPRTTQSEHGPRVAANHLLNRSAPTEADQVWVGDITYLPLQNGCWAYLAAFQDVHTKRVVGWQVRSSMPEELVVTALRRALLSRQPAAGLIVHSDRGGQYCGNVYRRLLTDRQLVRSRSRRGECYDNAQAESLWSRVKTEVLLDRAAFASVAEAQAELTTYFDYYNHQRRHSALGYECPHHFENQAFLTKTQLCLT